MSPLPPWGKDRETFPWWHADLCEDIQDRIRTKKTTTFGEIPAREDNETPGKRLAGDDSRRLGKTLAGAPARPLPRTPVGPP